MFRFSFQRRGDAWCSFKCRRARVNSPAGWSPVTRIRAQTRPSFVNANLTDINTQRTAFRSIASTRAGGRSASARRGTGKKFGENNHARDSVSPISAAYHARMCDTLNRRKRRDSSARSSERSNSVFLIQPLIRAEEVSWRFKFARLRVNGVFIFEAVSCVEHFAVYSRRGERKLTTLLADYLPIVQIEKSIYQPCFLDR